MTFDNKNNNANTISYHRLKYIVSGDSLWVGDTVRIKVDFSTDAARKLDISSSDSTKIKFLAADSGIVLLALRKGPVNIRIVDQATSDVQKVEFSIKSRLDDGVMRVLAIGNSFSGDAIESFLYKVVNSTTNKIVIGNLYIGGASLKDHINSLNSGSKLSYRFINLNGERIVSDKNILDVLLAEKWDFISVQQVSYDAGRYNSYFPFIDQLLNVIKANAELDVRIGFHQTWAYSNAGMVGFPYYKSKQLTMIDSIATVTKKIAERYNLVILPSGIAIQNARQAFDTDDLTRDGKHLSIPLGQFITSCVWYEKLFNDDVTTNSFIPSGVDAETARVAKLSAHKAVLSPYLWAK